MSGIIPPVPDGSAIITPNQQYAELQALRQSVDRLASTMDPALADIRKDVHDLDQAQKAQHTDAQKALQGQQSQIDAINRWRYMITGALVLLSSLVAYGLLNLARLGR